MRVMKDAYQKAIDSGHADVAPWAAFSLGVLLEGQGDIQGAKNAYQKAIDSGHAEVAPKAAFSLGNMRDSGTCKAPRRLVKIPESVSSQ
jgi:hypothetical protein